MASSSQTWDPERYARNARFVADLAGPALLELLAPLPGERILDLGCGDGVLTERLAALGAQAVGVDASADMVAAAQARGIDARVINGESLDFEHEFDAVFSNAALHWMRRPEAVLDGIRRALKPGGRFVAEFGGAGNIRAVLDAVSAALRRRGQDPEKLMPWYFPTVEEYSRLLTNRGFLITTIALIPRLTPLPGTLADWLDTFGGDFLRAVPPHDRAAVKLAVEDVARPALCDQQGRWSVDYVRLRVAAHL